MKHRKRFWSILLLATCVVTTGRVWAQLKPGIVVESVAKYSEAEKAGLQEGDVLLSWNRADAKGEIESPFDLSLIEIEQAPRGNVTLEGLRGTDKQAWVIGPDDWGIIARPNLPQQLLSIYFEGQELARAGKLSAAAARWRRAALAAPTNAPPWLRAWFFLHTARQFASVLQWKEADENYQQGVEESGVAGPAILSLTLRAWVEAWDQRSNDKMAGKYSLLALENSKKLGTETLLTAFMLSKAAGGIFGTVVPTPKEYYDQALAIQKQLAPHSLPLAQTLTNGGIILLWEGDFDGAQNNEREALAIEEELAPRSLKYASTLFCLGLADYYRGELADAEKHMEGAAEIQQKLAPGSIELSLTLNNLGNVFLAKGELPKAYAYLHQALIIRQKLSPGSFRLVSTLDNLGSVAWNRGDLTRAEKYYRQALAIQAKLFVGDSSAMILTSLGGISHELGDDKSAKRYFREALADWKKQPGPGKEFSGTLEAVGEFFKSRGDLAQAEEYYRQAFEIRKKEASDSPDIAESLQDRAEIAEERKDFVKAENYYRQALTIRAKQIPGTRDHAESLAALGRIKREQHQLAEATQFFEQSLNVLESQIVRLGGSARLQNLYPILVCREQA